MWGQDGEVSCSDLVLDQSETTLEKSATKQLGTGAVPLGLEGSFYLVGSQKTGTYSRKERNLYDQGSLEKQNK